MSIEIHDPSLLPKDFCIFFCWQDHLERKTHRFLIRDGINAAIARVQDELPDGVDCVLRQDSDTMNRAGSIEIANTILDKINRSTIVIGDITPVLADVENGRFYPNPNVMIEVGYAGRALGWNRVICLFNNASSRSEDLPFDVRHRRITAYQCDDLSQRKKAAKEVEAVLYTSIRAAIEEIARGDLDPSLGDATLKRQKDLRLVRRLMKSIHRNTLDLFIERGLNRQLHDPAHFFYIGFNAIVCSSQFLFYDKELERITRNLNKFWGEAVNLGGLAFFDGRRPGSFVLKPHPWHKSYEQLVDAMTTAYSNLAPSLRAFLEHVHNNYPEVDMETTDRVAWQDMLPYITGSHFDTDSDENPTGASADKDLE